MRPVFLAVLLLVLAFPARAAALPTTMRVAMEEYKFSPATITLKAGEPVRLELQNLGAGPHQFRARVFRGVDVWVRTPGFDARSERMEVIVVRPGATATIEFTRRTPGEYEFWCGATTDGRRHRDLGMRGRFVVTP